MIRITRLGHIVLRVRDLERSIHFYRDVLGLELVGANGNRIAFFKIDDTNHHDLAVMQVGPDAATPLQSDVGLYHFAFKVGNSLQELKAAKAWLEENGVTLVGQSDHTVTQSLYLLDPDGTELELYVDADPAGGWEETNVLAAVKPLTEM